MVNCEGIVFGENFSLNGSMFEFSSQHNFVRTIKISFIWC